MKQLTVLISAAAGLEIPSTVFDFELPVLEAAHTEENVKILSEETYDGEAMTAGEAYGFLKNKYEEAIVDQAYRSSRDLAKQSGLKSGDLDEDKREVHASVKVRQPAKKKKGEEKADEQSKSFKAAELAEQEAREAQAEAERKLRAKSGK